MVDGEEQNTIVESVPFVIGNEARPRVIEWTTTPEIDRIVAEHFGYLRLPMPVTHRRTIVFHKKERYWVIEDEFLGEGEHECEVRFHFGPGLEMKTVNNGAAATDPITNASLLVESLDLGYGPLLERQATSIDYGQKEDSLTACWRVSGLSKLRWILRPATF
jgi:hypothetical protein